MTDDDWKLAPANPFRSGRTRPGAIPFLFPAGTSAAELVAKLRATNWLGAIVGPHGSGKTTLLRSLEPHLRSAGRDVLLIELHDRQRRLPASFDFANVCSNTIVIVDGYEQLSWLSRIALYGRCRRAGCGLLVTAHRPVILPTLFSTSTNPELTRAVVRALLPEDLAHYRITDEDVDRAYALHSGNIREALFGLYDVYRERHQNSGE